MSLFINFGILASQLVMEDGEIIWVIDATGDYGYNDITVDDDHNIYSARGSGHSSDMVVLSKHDKDSNLVWSKLAPAVSVRSPNNIMINPYNNLIYTVHDAHNTLGLPEVCAWTASGTKNHSKTLSYNFSKLAINPETGEVFTIRDATAVAKFNATLSSYNISFITGGTFTDIIAKSDYLYWIINNTLRKATHALSTVWQKTFNAIYAVEVDDAGNVYVSVKDSDDKYYIIKYNSAGTQLWKIDLSDIYYFGRTIKVNSKGEIYIGCGGYFSTYPNLMKFDANGQEIWRKNQGVVSEYVNDIEIKDEYVYYLKSNAGISKIYGG